MTWDDIVVDHLDGSRDNNHPVNLVPSCNFCNMLRARSVLTYVDAEEIRALYRSGAGTQAAIGAMFGVSRFTVGLIVRNKIWVRDGS